MSSTLRQPPNVDFVHGMRNSQSSAQNLQTDLDDFARLPWYPCWSQSPTCIGERGKLIFVPLSDMLLSRCAQLVELRVGAGHPIKAKYIKVELRKIEVIPGGGPANTFTDVGA